MAVMLLAVPRAQPQDRFFDSNGVSIHYVEQGSGAPVLLLHGQGNTVQIWSDARVIDTLAKDDHVIAFDLRGHGLSGKPHDPNQYGREMALDAVRLLDRLRIPRAHIVGYSLGAHLTSLLLTLRPERFLSATLVGAAGRFEWTDKDTEQAELQAREAGSPAMAALIRGRRLQVVAPEQVKAVTVPTLGIVGSLDPDVGAFYQLQKLRPDVKLVVVEGATHGGDRGVLARPELLSALRAFISSRRRP
jgi:pimeloyl-ACP methyl ester carboxylesterase